MTDKRALGDLLMAVEFGYRQCEKGLNLQACMAKAEEILFEKNCACPENDAWRCAVARNLGTVSCHCECHRYIDRQEERHGC